jgi:hypothetical protein
MKQLMKGALLVNKDNSFDDEISRVLDILILKGLVEVNSVDAETGEFLYGVSPELFEILPDLKEEGDKMFLEMLDVLWIKGFVSMDKTSDNPVVSLTDLALDPESVEKLSHTERTALYAIMHALERKKDK